MNVDASVDRARRLVDDFGAGDDFVSVVNTYVCAHVGGCTCGSDGMAHMPGCGYEPLHEARVNARRFPMSIALYRLMGRRTH